jgi:hypothetical protein
LPHGRQFQGGGQPWGNVAGGAADCAHADFGKCPELKEKVFFFEKKKQKTFTRCRGLTGDVRKDIKVFWFFFLKKNILSS